MTIEEVIQAEVGKAGIPLFGITDLGIPPGFEQYQKWAGEGKNAGMHYLAREDALAKRKNPGMLMPGAKSILVFGLPYPMKPVKNSLNSMQIASYASVKDYHITIPGFLNGLVQRINATIGKDFAWKVFTDSAPIMERSLAQKAGLGWIGKNGCLISPQFGSFFFIAEILTELELTPTPPFVGDYCGKCHRCIDACPTGCLSDGDRTMDVHRCISYLTIENRKEIPRPLRSMSGNLIFGCDICQQVCPWNHSELALETPWLEREPGFSCDDISTELSLSETEFKRKYRESPILRAKRTGFFRNILCASGNSKDPVYITALQQILRNEIDALLRAHAAWALGKIDHQNARHALEAQYLIEDDPVVLEEINFALSRQDPCSQSNPKAA